jgi:hypothetical protein
VRISTLGESSNKSRSDKEKLVSDLLGAVAVEALQHSPQQTAELEFPGQKNALMLGLFHAPFLVQLGKVGDIVGEKSPAFRGRVL